MTPQVTTSTAGLPDEARPKRSLTPCRAYALPEPDVLLPADASDLRCHSVPAAAGTTSDTPTVDVTDTDADALTAPGVRDSAYTFRSQ